MKIILIGIVCLICFGCSGSKVPTSDQVNAGVKGVCTLLDAFAGSPKEEALCATAEQLAEISGLIRQSREAPADAGEPARKGLQCKIVPQTTVCATDEELAAAIRKVTKKDGGA